MSESKKKVAGVLLVPHSGVLLKSHDELGGGPPTAVKLPSGRWLGSVTASAWLDIEQVMVDPETSLDGLSRAIAVGWDHIPARQGISWLSGARNAIELTDLWSYVLGIVNGDMDASDWADFDVAYAVLGTFVCVDSDGREVPR